MGKHKLSITFILCSPSHSLVKLQRKIYSANQALELFIRTSWVFENEQFLRLHDRILPVDRPAFRYDRFVTADVREYLKNCVLGARRYLLKEPDENIPRAKRNYLRLWYLDLVTRIVVYGFLLYYALRILGIAEMLW